jgi:hypothetical protein
VAEVDVTFPDAVLITVASRLLFRSYEFAVVSPRESY